MFMRMPMLSDAMVVVVRMRGPAVVRVLVVIFDTV